MTGRLQGRVAIVTGASSGLGRAIAFLYAKEGAIVICADLEPAASNNGVRDNALSTHQIIADDGGIAKFVRTDVREEAQLESLVATAVENFGRLDIMVNNAGIAKDVTGLANQAGGLRLHESSTVDFDKTMKINTRGVFLGSKYAIAQFLRQEPLPVNSRGDRTRGWIVNMASTGGLVALQGAMSYVTSKHAVIGMTKQIAVDYAKDRIHCNALCPSFVPTPLISQLTEDTLNPIAVATVAALTAAHPWGTLGQTEDIARAAVFLVSDESQWMTGSALVIDGGYTAQ